MGIFLAILALIFFLCLVLIAAMHPEQPTLSHSELKRRSKKSEAFVLELDRYELHTALATLLRTVRAVLLVAIVCLLIGAFGWWLGIVGALVLAVIYPAAARIGGVRRWGQSLYLRSESWLLDFVSRFERILHGVREPATALYETPRRADSLEELGEIVDASKAVIGENERRLLTSALAFPDRLVKDVMTPRGVIDFIKNSEFLGPLVLDELHELGHSRLPVIDGDLDHIVGVLHLRDMLSLDVKRSTTAEKAMEAKVFYIREDDTLEHALAAFLKNRHHLFIVINSNRETVGLLTLEDVLEQLIGRRIIDEDDIHADLRAVAAQEGQSNNHPADHVDL
jgi:CBS domain containing-hemolysin-like protein